MNITFVVEYKLLFLHMWLNSNNKEERGVKRKGGRDRQSWISIYTHTKNQEEGRKRQTKMDKYTKKIRQVKRPTNRPSGRFKGG